MEVLIEKYKDNPSLEKEKKLIEKSEQLSFSFINKNNQGDGEQ